MSRARVTYQAVWYDDARRLTHQADYGDNGGSSFTRPGTPPEPNTSDDYIVVKVTYDAAGRRKDVTDNKGIVTRSGYDDLGWRVTQIEHYTNGTPTASSNRTTAFEYTADHQIRLQTAVMPSGTDDQVTRYVFSSELSDKGSPVKRCYGSLTPRRAAARRAIAADC